MRSMIAILSLVTCATVWADALPNMSDYKPPPDCTNKEYRQMDFVLGDWIQTTRKGHNTSRATLMALEPGCAIQKRVDHGFENWDHAFIFFDWADKKWHWHSMDDDGDAIHYIGEWKQGKMQFRAKDIETPHVEAEIYVMSLEPLAGGGFRLSRKGSEDGGKTFSPYMDLYYERAPK